MKAPKGDMRKLTDIRVTRKKNIHVGHGDGHGWAVSYADLLMVLLSFFVLYFSFADENPATVQAQLQRMAMAMKGIPQAEIEARIRAPASTGEMNKLSEALKIDGMRLQQQDDRLIVDLENAAYAPGAYEMNDHLAGQVDLVLQKLEPFKDNVALTIIGHADKAKLVHHRNKFLSDNFDLSSQRALRVLKYSISKGFPPNHASARAASFYDRDARSVTFEIRLAEAKPATEGAE